MRRSRHHSAPIAGTTTRFSQALKTAELTMKFASVVLGLLLFCAVSLASEVPASHSKMKPELLLPANYRTWVKLSPSMPGLPSHRHKHVAGRVFVEPVAFE